MPIVLDGAESEVEAKLSALEKLKDKWNKILDKITSYRILEVPLINYAILTIFGYLLIKLSTRYHKLYTKSSLVATIATNVVLYGIADTCAQSIPGWVNSFASRSSVLRRINRHPDRVQVTINSLETGRYRDAFSVADNEDIGVAFADYGDGGIGATPYEVELPDFTNDDEDRELNIEFNLRRFIGFVGWGFFMAFVQVLWYLFLNSMFNDMPTIVSVLERDLVDQLCFSPISLASFFAYSTIVIEKGNKEDYVKKMVDLYVTTLAVSFSVWFPVQFINFSIMPRNLQVPFSSSVGVLWNCYLSFRNAESARRKG